MSKWRIPTTCNDPNAPKIWVDESGIVSAGNVPPSGNSIKVVRWVSDGSSQYTLPVTPLDAQVVRRGQVLTPDEDYTLTGAEITFLEELLAGDSMQALLIY